MPEEERGSLFLWLDLDSFFFFYNGPNLHLKSVLGLAGFSTSRLGCNFFLQVGSPEFFSLQESSIFHNPRLDLFFQKGLPSRSLMVRPLPENANWMKLLNFASRSTRVF